MVWWIASWADDEQYRGRTASREVFLWWSVDELGSDKIPEALLLWWLSVFIEALVLFPNIEREGIRQQPF